MKKILAVLLLLTTSCVPKAQNTPSSFQRLFPAEFTISQHMVWSVRGKDYDFICYAKKSAQDLHITAFNELGGTVFDFSIDASGRVEIRKKPEHMPDMILKEGIGQDLLRLYNISREAIKGRRAVFGRNSQVILYFSQPAESGIPSHITILNQKLHYTLKIEILKTATA